MIAQAAGRLADGLLRLQARCLPITACLPRFYQAKPLIRKEARHTLDAACGAGEFTLWMASQGMRVSGVNLSRREIDVARARAAKQGLEVEFRVGDLSGRTPFPDGAFDQIVSLDTVVHIPDDAPVFREFARLLSPGGRLVLSVAAFAPSGDGALYAAQKALRRWAPARLHAPPAWNGRTWLRASPEDLRIGFRQYRFYRLEALLDRVRGDFRLERYEYGLRLFSALATDLVFGIRHARFVQPVLFAAGARLDRLLCGPTRPGYLLFAVLRKK